MPNWCSTDIVFYSDNVKQVENFHKRLVEIYEGKPTIPNDFGKGWLGDFVNTLLFPLTHESDIRCRGTVVNFDDVYKYESQAYFYLQEESAWVPALDMWQRILNRHFPDIHIAYSAVEEGCLFYSYYDPKGFFPDRYIVDLHIENVEKFHYFKEWYSSPKGVIDDLQELSDSLNLEIDVASFFEKEDGIDQLNQLFMEKIEVLNDENFFNLAKFIEDNDFSSY